MTVMQAEFTEQFFSIPLELPFLQVETFGPIVYGYGGCTGKIVLSPHPVCKAIYPSTPATEVPPAWTPPIDPPPVSTVPIPGTLILFALGLAMMKRVRQRVKKHKPYLENTNGY